MLIGALSQYFFGFTIFVLSTFLVLLVLVQRGRGGGLTGALGGPGGQSAFGTKAGDLFTRITIGVATAWIILCASAVFMLRGRALPETGGEDRPVAKRDAGAGASGTTNESGGAIENSDPSSKLDLQNFSLPNSELPALTSPNITNPSATEATPPATPSNTPPATDPPATDPPATDPPATDPPAKDLPAKDPAVEPNAPPATPELTPSATDTPPAPK